MKNPQRRLKKRSQEVGAFGGRNSSPGSVREESFKNDVQSKKGSQRDTSCPLVSVASTVSLVSAILREK